MLRNISGKALIQLTQIVNHSLRVGYLPYLWESAKVIHILKPGKSLSDTVLTDRTVVFKQTSRTSYSPQTEHFYPSPSHSTYRTICLPQTTFNSLPTAHNHQL
jgi:hypothetical protein